MSARGKTLRWGVVAPVAVAVGLLGASLAQGRIDTGRQAGFQEELLYLPNEKLLDHFTAGLSSVVADLLWLRCIQYMAREFRSQEHKFTWLEHMCTTVTRLDPYFTGAYQYGATLLAAIGNDEAAYALLERGIRARPDRWELPFEMAKIFILNRREEPGSAAAASYFLTMTAERSEHRDYFVRWAHHLLLHHDLFEDARRIWQDVYETTDDRLMRELAMRKLQELDLQKLCKDLTEAARRYEERLGRRPATIDQLVESGFIAQRPTDPVGGGFLIDDKGVVQSTTLLDGEAAHRLRTLRALIEQFRTQHGRWPKNLEELCEAGLIPRVPRHPYEDRTWDYNPLTGEVN